MRSSAKALVTGAVLGVAGGAALMRYTHVPGGDGLDDLTKDELYERAQKADIPGRSEMNKDELVRALRSTA